MINLRDIRQLLMWGYPVLYFFFAGCLGAVVDTFDCFAVYRPSQRISNVHAHFKGRHFDITKQTHVYAKDRQTLQLYPPSLHVAHMQAKLETIHIDWNLTILMPKHILIHGIFLGCHGSFRMVSNSLKKEWKTPLF